MTGGVVLIIIRGVRSLAPQPGWHNEWIIPSRGVIIPAQRLGDSYSRYEKLTVMPALRLLSFM
jgi:hypothetical protein